MPVPHSPHSPHSFHSPHKPREPREPHEAYEPQSSILPRATCDASCGPCRAGLHEGRGPEAAPLGSYRQLSNLGRAQETQEEEEQRKLEQRQQRQGKQ